MTEVLRLATADSTDSASKTDLKSGTFKLLRGGWTPSGPRPTMGAIVKPYGGSAEFSHFPRLTEVIDLKAEDTNANIINGIHAIDMHLEAARAFFDNPLEQYSRWLEYEIDSETRTKRALIYNGALELVNRDGLPGGFIDGKVFARLALERHPLWESIASDTYTTSGLSYFGGTYNITSAGTDTGSVPGRIGLLSLRGRSGSGPMYRAWVGIRPEYQGVGSFVSKWELEDGTIGTDTTVQTVSGMSGGDCMRCSFATDTSMVKRCSITLGDVVGSGYADFIGRYQVLLRVRLSSSVDAVGIQMAYGFSGQEYYYENEPVFTFASGETHLLPIGEIRFPPGGYRYTTSWYLTDLQDVDIEIRAELISSSSTPTYLYLDSLVLIPAEHMMTIDKADTALSDDQYRRAYISVQEDDQPFAVMYETASYTPRARLETSFHNWVFPLDPGIVVVAGERETAHDLTDDVDLLIYHWARWRHFADT